MADTVVLDGELSLSVPETAECNLSISADGEFGAITVLHTIPSNYGLITWDGSVLTVS